MTLKERFKQWFIDDEEDEHYEGMVEAVAIEHEKIADEFAIEFASWFILYYREEAFYNESYIKEMLEIYKKEKDE
tara:strand:- start:6424 stop:6648 length:225 start_codon:yes stop_codon:yes gene_type:complete